MECTNNFMPSLNSLSVNKHAYQKVKASINVASNLLIAVVSDIFMFFHRFLRKILYTDSFDSWKNLK